jgi:hypothetical protein
VVYIIYIFVLIPASWAPGVSGVFRVARGGLGPRFAAVWESAPNTLSAPNH